MTMGRPKELDGRTTTSVVFDATTIEIVRRHMAKWGGSFSSAVRALIARADRNRDAE